jgi:hypothetical protein
MIWGWLFGWIKVDIPKEITPLLSFCVFAAMVVIGANLSQRTAQTLGRNRNVLNIAKGSMVWIGGIAIYFLLMFLVIYFVWGVEVCGVAGAGTWSEVARFCSMHSNPVSATCGKATKISYIQLSAINCYWLLFNASPSEYLFRCL